MKFILNYNYLICLTKKKYESLHFLSVSCWWFYQSNLSSYFWYWIMLKKKSINNYTIFASCCRRGILLCLWILSTWNRVYQNCLFNCEKSISNWTFLCMQYVDNITAQVFGKLNWVNWARYTFLISQAALADKLKRQDRRQIKNEFKPFTSIVRTLKAHKFDPFEIHLVQQLIEDFNINSKFFLVMNDWYPNLLFNICSSDEC